MLDLRINLSQYLVSHGIEERIAIAYCDRVHRDYVELTPFLPERIFSFTDIGCGYGGHALYLAKHWGVHSVHLIDGDERKPKTASSMGFREQNEPWHDVGFAGLMVNQLTGIHVWVYYPPPTNYTCGEGCNFICSFTALGHHFSVNSYLPLINRTLSWGGSVLLDIRTGTDGKEVMERAGFDAVMVKSKPKFTRWMFTKREPEQWVGESQAKEGDV